MKIYRLLLFVLLLSACKTQSTIALRAHNSHDSGAQSTIIRDSVSVTYKQGKVVSLAENAENAEQESAEYKGNSIYAEHKRNNICELGDEEPRDSYRSYGNSDSLRTVPQSGTTMPREKSVKSASSARAIILRVDTVFVERWHTQTIPSTIALRAHNSRNGAPSTIPRFYKRCTWGFFILILLFLGRIAFRITKVIYFHR